MRPPQPERVCALMTCGKPFPVPRNNKGKRFCSGACQDTDWGTRRVKAKREERDKENGNPEAALVAPPKEDAVLARRRLHLAMQVAESEVVVLASRWPYPGMLELLRRTS